MRAILVCVDYADILSITLPYNRHHFSEVMVVTSPNMSDHETRSIAAANDCKVCITDVFYGGRNMFNKFAGLEHGISKFGRHGLMCVMDADIMFPKVIPTEWADNVLYTPRRRMFLDVTQPIPPETEWVNSPLQNQEEAFVGYTQIFNADNAATWLTTPWHDCNAVTAGGPDLAFQKRWPNDRKRRPDFEVLHLGPACINWCGRASAYTDGTVHPEAGARKKSLERTWPQIQRWQSLANDKDDKKKNQRVWRKKR